MTEQIILTLNAGLSSLKFALFTASGHPKRLWSGSIDRIDGLLRRGLRAGDAGLVPFLHSHGETGRTADERRG